MITIRKSFAAALFATLPLIALTSAQAAAAPSESTSAPAATIVVDADTPGVPPAFQAVAGKRFTDAEDRAAARDLGYAEAKVGKSHGCLIFKHEKKNLYISQDVDGHNGGRWKMASSPENLASKKTRMGTYDANLNRIGD
ncbi:toxin C-terminal domain-containing protein [Nocardia brasiliensis]|uniref:toxin C-terminal domain-containing protein n=1 Tax=Nocardia brasiliensis TaxID=37326 RepID=UPI002455F0E9|nr:toxin C-terminal domain-containing protein [Nocardia brasiliensis]